LNDAQFIYPWRIFVEEIKIIYIAGYTRSGTTILSRILGELEGVINIGEVYPLWQDGWLDDQLCECGQPFSKCEFWQEVIRKAFGSNSLAIAQNILEQQSRVNRFRYLPQLFFPNLRSKKFNTTLREYQGLLQSFYQAVAQVSGKTVIIDPSKHIAHAVVLAEIFNTTVIHMVRDSRAVAFSWLRKKPDPARSNYLPIIPSYLAALEWDYFNLWGEMLPHKAAKYMLLRYSDFAANPGNTISSLEKFAGIPLENIFRDDHIVRTHLGHVAVGNPDRFTSGDIAIEPDNAWVSKISTFDKSVVTAFTWPLLARYGYL
jgi:hypothetical protein